MSAPRKLDQTQRVAEDLVSVLDFLSRVMQAIDEGEIHYLWDKSRQLAEAAQRLNRGVDEPHEVTFNPAKVRELVQRDGRHYAAARALYPAPDRTAEQQRIAEQVEQTLGGGR